MTTHTSGSLPIPAVAGPTLFEAEPNHSHLLVLDDGTLWTAPGLELEFRARLLKLIANEFKDAVPLDRFSLLKGDELQKALDPPPSQYKSSRPPVCILVLGGSLGIFNTCQFLLANSYHLSICYSLH